MAKVVPSAWDDLNEKRCSVQFSPLIKHAIL
jgi:hypothetical protein